MQKGDEDTIINMMYYYARHMVDQPVAWQSDKEIRMPSGTMNMYLFPLYRKYLKTYMIGQELLTKLHIMVRDAIKKHGNDGSDFMFLAYHNRNWKSECVVCLEEEMMGTKCTCGHTEIVVFRPCGHSVCKNPCYDQLMAKEGGKSEPKIYTTGDGQKFTSGKTNMGSKNPSMCPTCQTPITHAFEAQEVHVPEALTKVLVEKFKEIFFY
jgi:hypothetical protein